LGLPGPRWLLGHGGCRATVVAGPRWLQGHGGCWATVVAGLALVVRARVPVCLLCTGGGAAPPDAADLEAASTGVLDPPLLILAVGPGKGLG